MEPNEINGKFTLFSVGCVTGKMGMRPLVFNMYKLNTFSLLPIELNQCQEKLGVIKHLGKNSHRIF